jgi:iron-only hydrogenase group A
MEESAELIKRINDNGLLPMFTSCCPGWVKYIEQNRPQLLEHVSSCKSPHEMEGAVLKTYYAEKTGISPEDIYVVSIMPCTVKKFESERDELSEDFKHDVDAVLTTRELVRMFKMYGIEFTELADDNFDNPLGESTGAAAIFGTSGGVMQAALRTAYYKLTGTNLQMLNFEELRGNAGIKESTVNVNGMDVKIAVVNGIGNIGTILDDIENGKSEYHFIEVMACPDGCINGGGQPIHQKTDKVIERVKALYEIDEKATHRMSHENDSIRKIYSDYFVEPNSHKAHEILHTTYTNRKEILRDNIQPIK